MNKIYLTDANMLAVHESILEVYPELAEELTMSSTKGGFHLVYRGEKLTAEVEAAIDAIVESKPTKKPEALGLEERIALLEQRLVVLEVKLL